MKNKENIMKTVKIRRGFLPIGLFVLLGLIMNGCAAQKIMTKSFESQHIIHYSEIKNWDESKTLNNYVVYVNPGETIPMTISLDTDFMAFKQKQIDLVVKQRLYFLVEMKADLSAAELAKLKKINSQSFAEMSPREKKAFFENYKIYLSRDAHNWASLYDSRACREVLGFKSGMLSLGMFISTTHGLGTTMTVKTIK
jgi:hypothetical protein